MTGVPVSAEGPSHPSPESPSSLLERAARRLEDLSGSASSAPWRSGPHPTNPEESNVLDSREVPLFTSSCCGGNCYGYVERSEDAAWIATLNPSVATPLVAWLRAEANTAKAWADTAVRWPGVPDSYRDAPPSEALKFARIVLGVPLEQEET